MRIHYLVHAPFEKLGSIGTWITAHQFSAKSSHTYRGEPLPDVSEFDMLIIMGGPQSVCEIDAYPYLYGEVDLIKAAIAADKFVLGVCLGVQLISYALGEKTVKSPHKEIGVFPVTVTTAGQEDRLFKLLPEKFAVMHWHNDMAGLPKGAVIVAESPGCPRQAIRFSDKVYGFQFHLELTPGIVRALIENCSEDLAPDTYVQTKEQILTEDLHPSHERMIILLEALVNV